MLIDFKFTNFRSFKETADLDLTATRVTEFPHHIVQTAGEKVLRTAVIYGANASGKSNIYNALSYMQYYVLNSFGFDEDTKKNPEDTYQIKTSVQFLLDRESKNSDTTFEIWFTIPKEEKECVYNYGFSLNKDSVTEEWLNYKTITGRKYNCIFYREFGKAIEFKGIPKKLQENLQLSLNNATLLVSLGAKLRVEKLAKIQNWFKTLTLMDFGDPFQNLYHLRHIPKSFAEDPDVRKKVAAFINTFDRSITGFTVKKYLKNDNTEGLEIYAVHKNPETGEDIGIPLPEESAGTQKMFATYSSLDKALTEGGVLFIDELSDRLHPLLVRNIIQTFIDPERNRNNAQLIFTTHDVWQLSGKLFRRDEIWFTEKGKDSATTLYSLVDIKGENEEKIRNDANILKNYTLGKYGGIPEIEKIDTFSADGVHGKE